MMNDDYGVDRRSSSFSTDDELILIFSLKLKILLIIIFWFRLGRIWPKLFTKFRRNSDMKSRDLVCNNLLCKMRVFLCFRRRKGDERERAQHLLSSFYVYHDASYCRRRRRRRCRRRRRLLQLCFM